MGYRAVSGPLDRRQISAWVTALGIAAGAVAGALLYGNRPDTADCPLLAAQFNASDSGALVIRTCGIVSLPIGVAGVAVRYDLQLSIQLLSGPARP